MRIPGYKRTPRRKLRIGKGFLVGVGCGASSLCGPAETSHFHLDHKTASQGVSVPDTKNPEQNGQTIWDRVAESREFRDLMATKKVFIIPAFLFFLVYYFLLPVLVGYAPRFMSIKVWGNVNLAYLFALSQFFMAWTIAGLYVRAGDSFDEISKDIIEKSVNDGRSKGE